MSRRVCTVLVLLTLVGWPGAAQFRVAPAGERPDTVALELALRKLSNTGTFMQTDAHPDDEDNGLLAMLGLGQGMRATLVTLTRTRSVPNSDRRSACCGPRSCSPSTASTGPSSTSRAPSTSGFRSAWR